jgi:hypothetical protein
MILPGLLAFGPPGVWAGRTAHLASWWERESLTLGFGLRSGGRSVALGLTVSSLFFFFPKA